MRHSSTVRSVIVQYTLFLFIESFAQIFQSGFSGKSGMGLLHGIHECLCRIVGCKQLLHLFQIGDLEFHRIARSRTAVSADEQCRTRVQRIFSFRYFCVDSGRGRDLQVADMCLCRSPVGVICLSANQDACAGKIRCCTVLPVGISVRASPNACSKPFIMPP